MTTSTLGLVMYDLAVDVLLGTTIIEEHILGILSDGRNVTIRDSIFVGRTAQGNMPTNAVQTTNYAKKSRIRLFMIQPRL